MDEDFYPAIVRERSILVEALMQQTLLRKEAMLRGVDPRPFIIESERLATRLSKVQTEIEGSELDD